MKKHTNFDNINAFFEYSKLQFSTEEEFQAIPENIKDKEVIKFTSFNSWKEMLSTAVAEYLNKELFKGV
ncbi:hypothetical protein MWH25_12385 [Natroniella acetigena]|uniref:hypothetical protein n=1 Tax=Natroniella acetigena TaxID=52004 RepID=UPI00200B7B49|nr:hypothetical protein [Natroniella acetigena]MCK8828521.1 hypothetical protein [Natroniella acetigena]